MRDIASRVFRNTAVYSAGTVVAKLAGFLLLPIYAHYFQTEGYGVMGMIDTSFGVLSIIITGGFQVGILRIFHESATGQRSRTLSTGVLLVWGIGLCLIAIPFVFSGFFSRLLFGTPEYSLILMLALISFVIDTAGKSASTSLIISDRSILFSAIYTGQLILGLLLNIWLVVILKVGLIGIFLSSLISASVASAIFHYLAIRQHGSSFDTNCARLILAFQLPLIPGQIISFIGRQTERVLVRLQLGLGGVGILEMAYRFPPMINFLLTIPFYRAWQTKSFEVADEPDAPVFMGEMFSRFLFLIVFAALLLGVAIEGILKALTPPDFWPAIRVTQIEAVTTILVAATRFTSFGLNYAKKTSVFSIVQSILAPVKIAVAYLLISHFGLAGAAFSALIIEIVSFLILTNRSQNLYRIRYQYFEIGLLLVSAAAIFMAIEGRLVPYYNEMLNVTNYVLGIFVANDFVTVRFFDIDEDTLQMIRERIPALGSAILNVLLATVFLAIFPLMGRGRPDLEEEMDRTV